MVYRGLVVPLPTLFDAKGGLDPVASAEFAADIRKNGADRLFVLGSLGEFPSVSFDEREALVSAIVASRPEAKDVWVGVGAPSTRDAIRYAKSAESAGASAIVAVPPYYLHPSPAAIERYYRAIHAAVKLPMYSYNIPSLVGYSLDSAMVHRLAKDGVLVGTKDTSNSLASVGQFLAGAPSGFEVYPGDDHLAAEGIRLGAAGAVMGLANVLPKLARDLVMAAHSSNATETARLQALIEALEFIVAGGPFPAAGKFLAAHLRRAKAGYRAPYDPLTPEEERRVLDRWSALKDRLGEFV